MFKRAREFQSKHLKFREHRKPSNIRSEAKVPGAISISSLTASLSSPTKSQLLGNIDKDRGKKGREKGRKKGEEEGKTKREGTGRKSDSEDAVCVL